MSLLKQQKLTNSLREMGLTLKNPENYENLNSVLEIECSKGHVFSGTYQDLDYKRYECIECLKEFDKNPKDKEGFLLALDAATVTTGYAILNKKGQLLEAGLIEIDKKLDLWDRIHNLMNEITKLCKKFSIQVIAIEDIQMQQNVSVFKTLAMLRGVLLYELEYKKKYTIYSASAEEWRSFNYIKGYNRENKKEATRIKAKLIYERDFAEDEADAIFLAKYAYQMHFDRIHEYETKNLMAFGSDL